MSNVRDSLAEFPELAAVLGDLKRYFLYVGLFSAAINLLLLVPILYMLQVYDRVLASGSLATLTMLTLILVGLLMAMGGFEWVRSRIMIAASNRMEERLHRRVSDATFQRALMSGGMAAGAQPLHDLTQLRQYLTGNGLFAFFDSPWVLVYLAVMYLFHVWFGVAATVAVIIMLVLAYVNEKTTNDTLQEANSLNARLSGQVSSNLRNAESVAAMGMGNNIYASQQSSLTEILKLQTGASQRASGFNAISKTFRLTMQSLVLGLGALLALQQQISPGMMIAGALLLSRALAPIDAMVAGWKGFSLARIQYRRLGELLQQLPEDSDSMSLPAPTGRLTLQNAIVIPPGAKDPVVKGVSLELLPGEALGLVGPSAAGKSSLARAMLGIWPVRQGSVRLDGVETSQWDRTELGPHIGYLPQDIELFDGSIAANISRFGELDSEKVVDAARMAGVHDLILQLPEGYDTVIGATGGVLSGGQRQRIALARALYDQPSLVVLDEPNSNLDDQGERELVEAVNRLKAAGSAVVVISHRTMILHAMDKMLVLNNGIQAEYGSREEVLAKLMQVGNLNRNGARVVTGAGSNNE